MQSFFIDYLFVSIETVNRACTPECAVTLACAKPRLQKPCGGQALRRRQGTQAWFVRVVMQKTKKPILF